MTNNCLKIHNDEQFRSEMTVLRDDIVVAAFSDDSETCLNRYLVEESRRFTRAYFLLIDTLRCTRTTSLYKISSVPTVLFMRGTSKLDYVRGNNKTAIGEGIRLWYPLARGVGVPKLDEDQLLVNIDQTDNIYNHVARNASPINKLSNIFDDEPTYVETDFHEQLLFQLHFVRPTNIGYLRILAPEGYGPKIVKLYGNRLVTPEFDEIGNSRPMCILNLKADEVTGEKLIRLPAEVCLEDLKSLTVYVCANLGHRPTTRINRFVVYGTNDEAPARRRLGPDKTHAGNEDADWSSPPAECSKRLRLTKSRSGEEMEPHRLSLMNKQCSTDQRFEVVEVVPTSTTSELDDDVERMEREEHRWAMENLPPPVQSEIDYRNINNKKDDDTIEEDRESEAFDEQFYSVLYRLKMLGADLVTRFPDTTMKYSFGSVHWLVGMVSGTVRLHSYQSKTTCDIILERDQGDVVELTASKWEIRRIDPILRPQTICFSSSVYPLSITGLELAYKTRRVMVMLILPTVGHAEYFLKFCTETDDQHLTSSLLH